MCCVGTGQATRQKLGRLLGAWSVAVGDSRNKVPVLESQTVVPVFRYDQTLRAERGSTNSSATRLSIDKSATRHAWCFRVSSRPVSSSFGSERKLEMHRWREGVEGGSGAGEQIWMEGTIRGR